MKTNVMKTADQEIFTGLKRVIRSARRPMLPTPVQVAPSLSTRAPIQSANSATYRTENSIVPTIAMTNIPTAKIAATSDRRLPNR